MHRSIVWIVAILGLLYGINAANVVGIDFGSEWIKVGMVKAGAGVQIVLNEASKRKAPNAIALDEDFRTWGDVALSKPHLSYQRVRELLGKRYDEEYIKNFPANYFGFKTRKLDERGTFEIVHQTNSSKGMQPEELTAMVLSFVVDMAASFAKERVEDVVITVPSYYTQFERQAMLDAAEIAGLNVLTLINDHAALSLKFGIDHKVENLQEPINVMFYDMGSTSTVVSIVTFSAIPDKEAGKNKTQGQFQVRSVAWDTGLGGFTLTSIVADEVMEMSGKRAELQQRPRNMGKLMKEAEKTKQVLSANKESMTMIESLVGDYDFKGTITREKLEAAAAKSKYWERILEPVKQALAQAEMTVQDIHRIEMVGGAWRVPRVQTALREFFGRTDDKDLDKTLNGDESFAYGAALYAASLSTAFRLRKFGAHDISQFSITVDIESSEAIESDDEEKSEGQAEPKAAAEGKGMKTIKLFKKGHKLPAKRRMRFKRDEDFVFHLRYDTPAELPPNTPTLIGTYNVTGIVAAANKYANSTKPQVNVAFRLLRNGMIEVETAEAAVEQSVEVEECESPKKKKDKKKKSSKDDEETKDDDFAKLDDDKSGFLTDAEFKSAAKLAPSTAVSADVESYLTTLFAQLDEDSDNKVSATEFNKITKPVAQLLADKFDEEEKSEDESSENKEKNKDEEDSSSSSSNSRKCVMKTQKRIHRMPLHIIQLDGGLQPMSSAQKRESRRVLNEFEERERLQRERAQAQNDLESYIYATREKSEADEFKSVTSEEQRQEIDAALTKAAQWLDDEGYTAKTKELKDHLRSVKDLTEPCFLRLAELEIRPKIVAETRAALKKARLQVNSTMTSKPWLTDADAQEVLTKIDKAEQWIDDKEGEQVKKSAHEAPAFLSIDVPKQLDPITVAFRKFERIPKPKPPPKAKKADNSTATADNSTTATTASQGDDEPIEVSAEFGGDNNTTATDEAQQQKEEAQEKEPKQHDTTEL